MKTTTIRISTEIHAILKQIAKEEDESMQTVLDRLLQKYRRENLLYRTNDAFAALRSNPEEWGDEQEERAFWDQTLADDVE